MLQIQIQIYAHMTQCAHKN